MGSPLSLPTFSYFGSSGLPTELPTELPTVSIYGSSGQPNLHGKIPMGSPRATHSVAHVQPRGSEVGSSPVFPYGRFPVQYPIRSNVGDVKMISLMSHRTNIKLKINSMSIRKGNAEYTMVDPLYTYLTPSTICNARNILHI